MLHSGVRVFRYFRRTNVRPWRNPHKGRPACSAGRAALSAQAGQKIGEIVRQFRLEPHLGAGDGMIEPQHGGM